jgi:hypothetical protein
VTRRSINDFGDFPVSELQIRESVRCEQSSFSAYQFASRQNENDFSNNCELCEFQKQSIQLGLSRFACGSDGDGDRLWYQNQFKGNDLERIENTRLSDIVRRNTSLRKVRKDLFHIEQKCRRRK